MSHSGNSAVGLPLDRGRLRVTAELNVPGHPDVFACGDAAAVPDLTRPLTEDDAGAGAGAGNGNGNRNGARYELTPMTAQHATRQGDVAANNVAA
ncbi:NAD(P)/FAD-dependent oxidoreductase, partial [Streptomyces tirandamycinicus]|nr:NAD(P)/FAD-dependent oxidoreductase [Streptomyces tirandamycinicus]